MVCGVDKGVEGRSTRLFGFSEWPLKLIIGDHDPPAGARHVRVFHLYPRFHPQAIRTLTPFATVYISNQSDARFTALFGA